MNIEFTCQLEPSDVALLFNGLVDFNAIYLPDLKEIQCGAFVLSNLGEKEGGLTGRMLYTTLQINYLWLPDHLRSKGYGRALLEKVEHEAKQLGIESICVDTYSFQAPEFYRKRGYREVGRYKDYLKVGIDKIFFQKTI